jgi:hypothetical protein
MCKKVVLFHRCSIAPKLKKMGERNDKRKPSTPQEIKRLAIFACTKRELKNPGSKYFVKTEVSSSCSSAHQLRQSDPITKPTKKVKINFFINLNQNQTPH